MPKTRQLALNIHGFQLTRLFLGSDTHNKGNIGSDTCLVNKLKILTPILYIQAQTINSHLKTSIIKSIQALKIACGAHQSFYHIYFIKKTMLNFHIYY